jgi:hypothetical protein
VGIGLAGATLCGRARSNAQTPPAINTVASAAIQATSRNTRLRIPVA